MAFGSRQSVVYVRPEPHTETVPEVYARLLDAPPLSPLAHALAFTIGTHQDKQQALAFSRQLVNDPEPLTRTAGVVALVWLHREGQREAEKALLHLIEDPDPRVRAVLAHELHCDSTLETSKLLQFLAKDSVAEVRKEAAGGLYFCEDVDARQALFRLTRDPEDSVRDVATNSLGWIDGEPIDIKDFMHLLDDPSPGVRMNMASWLGWVDKAFALPYLLQLSHDREAGVRNEAIKVLGEFGEDETFRRMKEATSDPSEWVRASALKNLLERKDPEITDLLIDHASDPSPEVRRAAASGLESRATPEMLPLLEKLTEDEASVMVRRSVARCLEIIPGEEAERLLVCLMHDPAVTVSKTAKKVLKNRARTETLDLGTVNELRFGRKQAVATRIAFKGRTRQPLKAWDAFLAKVQRLDGVPTADSDTSPAIQFETAEGAQYCILPFGPAHWMQIRRTHPPGSAPLVAYKILGTPEMQTWSKGVSVANYLQGRVLCMRLGWFGYGNQPDHSVDT